MSYQQLVPEQRYQIEASIGIGMSRTEIAKKIGVHRSTVYREMGRNSDLRLAGYRAISADAAARDRHKRKKKRRIEGATWARVKGLLEKEWSPEQISKRLKLESRGEVSHESIYLYVYTDKRKGGELCKHLRRRHVNRKRHGKYYNRKGWDTRRSISERPAVVAQRCRFGDWEADTIIGRRQKGSILSLVERKSRWSLLEKLHDRSPDTLADAISRVLRPFKDNVLTITSDNGFEFRSHQRIASDLDADFFFADPYSSWQRGTVENTNGLVRQYIPKKSDFDLISSDQVHLVANALNHRPRKVLNFKTPFEVFFNQSVALIT